MEARKKLDELRREQREQRAREREFFKSKFGASETPAAEAPLSVEPAPALVSNTADQSGETVDDETEALNSLEEDFRIVNSLTDRAASARLSSILSGAGSRTDGSDTTAAESTTVTCRMGPQSVFFGPVSVKPEEAGFC